MKSKTILAAAFFLAFSGGAAYGASWELTPGRLPDLIGELGPQADKELVLTGTVNASDLGAIRNLPPTVERLDMRQLQIKGDTLVGRDLFGYTEFADGEIPPYMAYCTSLKEVALPDNVSVIGASAFASTSLVSIDCAGAKRIGENAFRNCTRLKKANLSSSGLRELPEGIFDGCSALEDIKLPQGITKVGDHAFQGSGIKEISLPEAISLGAFSFAMTPSLTSITLPSQCHVGTGAFYGASALTKLNGSMMEIPDLLAAGTILSADSILMRGPEIGAGAFAGSRVVMGVLGEKVDKIGALAFADMKELQKLDVTALGARIPEVADNSFSGTDISKVILYVLTDTEEAWKAAPVWRDFIISSRGLGVSSPEAPGDVRISIGRDGRKLSVSSDRPIDEIGIYGADGRVAGVYRPAVMEFSVEPDMDGEVMIVRVVSGGITKIVKLMTWEKTN